MTPVKRCVRTWGSSQPLHVPEAMSLEQERPGTLVSPLVTQGLGGWQEAMLLRDHANSGRDAGL